MALCVCERDFVQTAEMINWTSAVAAVVSLWSETDDERPQLSSKAKIPTSQKINTAYTKCVLHTQARQTFFSLFKFGKHPHKLSSQTSASSYMAEPPTPGKMCVVDGLCTHTHTHIKTAEEGDPHTGSVHARIRTHKVTSRNEWNGQEKEHNKSKARIQSSIANGKTDPPPHTPTERQKFRRRLDKTTQNNNSIVPAKKRKVTKLMSKKKSMHRQMNANYGSRPKWWNSFWTSIHRKGKKLWLVRIGNGGPT